jgi:hypothetical protein
MSKASSSGSTVSWRTARSYDAASRLRSSSSSTERTHDWSRKFLGRQLDHALAS